MMVHKYGTPANVMHFRLMNCDYSLTTTWHLHRPILLPKIESGEMDPSFVITHTMGLGEAPKGYQIFDDKVDGCIKV